MDDTFRFNFIQGESDKRKRRLIVLRAEIEALESDIALLERWAGSLAVKVCSGCGGTGKVRYFLAQDESEIRNCEECSGTGVPQRIS